MLSRKSYRIRVIAAALTATVGMAVACPQAKADERLVNSMLVAAACGLPAVGLIVLKSKPTAAVTLAWACTMLGGIAIANAKSVSSDSPEIATQKVPASTSGTAGGAPVVDENGTSAAALLR